MRLGVRNGVSKRLFGELLCDARAKNTRVRASKHEITIFPPLVTMHDNIFVFGANFLRFGVIFGMTFGAWRPESIPNFVLQPGIVIGAPFGRPSGNEGLGKDHVEEFLETFCAFGGSKWSRETLFW